MSKATLFILIALFFASIGTQAEENPKFKSINGFMFGFTIGKFNKNFIGSGFQGQVGGGLTIGYKNLKGFNNNFSRSFEFIYNNRSARFEGRNSKVRNINISTGEESAAENYHSYSFNYLEVPLILYWHPGKQYMDHRSEKHKVNLKMGFGISPALCLGSKYRYNVYIADEPPPGPLNIPVNVTEKQKIKTFNDSRGLTGNLIFDLHLGVSHGKKSTFFLYGRYYHMLTSAFIDEYPNIKLRTFAFGAGWLF